MEGNHRYYLQLTGDFGWPLMEMITGQRVFADCGFWQLWFDILLFDKAACLFLFLLNVPCPKLLDFADACQVVASNVPGLAGLAGSPGLERQQ